MSEDGEANSIIKKKHYVQRRTAYQGPLLPANRNFAGSSILIILPCR